MANSRSTDLPKPTRNLNTAAKNLNEFGYCLVTDVLSSVETDALRTRLIEQATAEKQKGLAFEDGGPQQNWGDFRDVEG